MGKIKLEIVCEACESKISLKFKGFPARCWCPICGRSLIIDEVNQNTTTGAESGILVYSFPDHVLASLGWTLDDLLANYKDGKILFTGDIRGIQFVEEN